MKFSATNIPEVVRDNVVYLENGNYTIENKDIRTPYQNYLTEKEVHNLVKAAVCNNKVSVLQLMLEHGFNLKVIDLTYLSCQHGCYEMTKLLLDRGVK